MLYKDTIKDLLVLPASPPGGAVATKKKPKKEPSISEKDKVPFVRDLVHVPVLSTCEAINLLMLGEKKLQVASRTTRSTMPRRALTPSSSSRLSRSRPMKVQRPRRASTS